MLSVIVGSQRVHSGASFAAQRASGAAVLHCTSPRCGLPYLAAQGGCDECARRIAYNGADVPIRRWRQRSVLFSLWEETRAPRAAAAAAAGTVDAHGPLRMDAEGWFSLTPEVLADGIAADVCAADSRSGSSATDGIVVLDLFAGCGGNAIAFARATGAALEGRRVRAVVAVDSCAERLAMARANAAHYAAAAAASQESMAPIFFVLGDAAALVADLMMRGGAVAGGGSANSGGSAGGGRSTLDDAGVFTFCASDAGPATGAAQLACSVLAPSAAGALPGLLFTAQDGRREVVALHACFAAPPWGGEAYLTRSAAGDAAAAPRHVAVAADLDAQLHAPLDAGLCEGGEAGDAAAAAAAGASSAAMPQPPPADTAARGRRAASASAEEASGAARKRARSPSASTRAGGGASEDRCRAVSAEFDIDSGLAIDSGAGPRLESLLGGAGAPQQAAPSGATSSLGTRSVVGGELLLTALLCAFPERGVPLFVYLPRNVSRRQLLERRAAGLPAAGGGAWRAILAQPDDSAPPLLIGSEGAAAGTAPAGAAGASTASPRVHVSLKALFLDDRRDATALLLGVGAVSS